VPPRSIRVLVADPDADCRKRVAGAVEAAAQELDILVKVDQAADGTTALALWGDHKPDLVVCEVLLEGISGLELLRRVREQGAKPSQPDGVPQFVLVTTLARDVDRYWGLRNGAHAYVPKPFDDGNLRARLRKLLESGPAATPEAP
jgi:twitching motility two-component system response regulator PilH